MKKILIVADSLKSGGVEQTLESFLDVVSRLDCKVELLVLNGNRYNKTNNVKNLQVNPKITPFFNSIKRSIMSMNVIFIIKSVLLALLLKLHRHYGCLSAGNRIRYYLIDKYINISSSYDLAIAFNISHLTYLVDRKVKSKKKVAWFHGDASILYSYLKHFKVEMEKMDEIVCVSKKSRESLLNLFGLNNVIVIENYVKLTANENFDNPFKNYSDFYKIICVGRLSREKGYYEFLTSISDFVKRNNCVLIFIGEGPEHSKMIRFVKRKNLSKQVIFLGWVDNPMDYVQYSDLMVHPSIYEGFGLSIYESAFLGINVVCYDVADAREKSKFIKNINVVNSQNDLINCIQRFYKSSNKRIDNCKELQLKHNSSVENSIKDFIFKN